MYRTAFRMVLGALLLCLTFAAAHADKIDDYIQAEMVKRHIPGLSVAVVQDGKVTLAKGYGKADIELSVPATQDTIYEIGSMTKQFTATCIMMLVEEGKVSLDDKITKTLTGLPDAWKDITLRHLLTHTSGIKAYTAVGDFVQLARTDHTPEEIIKSVASAPLEFKPGEKWAYCNTGYYLLGMIIEKASGKKYWDFLGERIFKPLDMTVSRNSDPKTIIPNRARGYGFEGGVYVNRDAITPTAGWSAGSIVSNVLDMAKWDAALYTTKLLKTASLAQMWTPAKLNDGKPANYGFGWGIETYNGHRLLQHSGGTAAFSTIISRFVDDKLTVIVLTNLSGTDGSSLAKNIAGFYVPALKPVVAVAIEDKDPKMTAFLKQVLQDAVQGKGDPNLFAPKTRAILFPDLIKQAGKQLSALGPLKSFQLIGFKADDKHKAYRYRIVLGETALNAIFALNADGKIETMFAQPE